MSAALFIPAPHAATDTRLRSDALSRCLDQLLQQLLEATDLLTLQVSCPLLLDGPVCAQRTTGGRGLQARVLSVEVLTIPATQHVPEASLLVAATDDAALQAARALPVLLSAVMESELSRLIAEATARGALEIANRDPATGLGNRRAWLHTLRLESGRAQRTGSPFTIVILDIDGLKAVNDSQGHAAGDALIIRAGLALAQARRATDVVCRLGGDEFGIAAPDTDPLQARLLATRLRASLEAQSVPVSIGWATGTGHGTVDDVWQQADASMYEDKRSRH